MHLGAELLDFRLNGGAMPAIPQFTLAPAQLCARRSTSLMEPIGKYLPSPAGNLAGSRRDTGGGWWVSMLGSAEATWYTIYLELIDEGGPSLGTDTRVPGDGCGEMYCAGCEQRLSNALRRLPGVQEVQASATTQRVQVTVDPSQVGAEQVRAKLEQLGYQAKIA
jgi:copper chaperone CopZ